MTRFHIVRMKKAAQGIKRLLVWTVCIWIPPALHAQNVAQDTIHIPALSFFRAEEDYAYLRQRSADTVDMAKGRFDAIKFIPLNREENIWLSFGGQYRPRFEFFDQRFLQKTNGTDSYYSHRMALNASINLTDHFRVFGEFYHGMLSRAGNTPVQDDPLALHQLFVEPKIKWGGAILSLRLGRQEMSYGISRLIGMREGPNIRLSFDAARLKYERNTTSIDAFYGREVLPNFEVFNDRTNKDMGFWGVYSKFFITNGNGFTDLYYLGLNRKQATYEAGSAEENRHTFGLRMSGKNGERFHYNTELMYQFGTFGDHTISSFAAELDYRYVFQNMPFKPVLGLKLDYIAGDKDINDDKHNSFNSLFANPTYFGLSSTIAPTNLFDIHPSVRLNFTDKIGAGLNWDFLWRASTDDGVYAPAGFLLFPGSANDHRFIGQEFGVNTIWVFGPHLNLSGEFSCLVPGRFIKEQNGGSLTYFSITASYKI